MDRFPFIAGLCVLFLSVSASPDIVAQCLDDNNEEVAEGESPPDNECQICRNGSFDDLPEHTICGDNRLECTDDGRYREECTDRGAGIECALVKRADECPGGFECADTDDGRYCLSSCEDDGDCQAGFECDGQTCVAVPMADMGETDMGETDMGPGGTDTGSSDADMDETLDMDQTDIDGAGEGDAGAGQPPTTEEGCCFVAAAKPDSEAALMLIGVLVLITIRRRSES